MSGIRDSRASPSPLLQRTSSSVTRCDSVDPFMSPDTPRTVKTRGRTRWQAGYLCSIYRSNDREILGLLLPSFGSSYLLQNQIFSFLREVNSRDCAHEL